jgi:hypothetical protein
MKKCSINLGSFIRIDRITGLELCARSEAQRLLKACIKRLKKTNFRSIFGAAKQSSDATSQHSEQDQFDIKQNTTPSKIVRINLGKTFRITHIDIPNLSKTCDAGPD